MMMKKFKKLLVQWRCFVLSSRTRLRMKRLFGRSGRFDPSPAAERVPATVVRVIAAGDYDSCIDIYKDNKAKFFPDGYLKDFEQDLSSDACLWLGLEDDGDLIAVGGIHLDTKDTGAAALAFGMVRPEKHGMGYGSALLLARIASLPRPDPVIRIVMSSLEETVGFYKRFGFVFVTRVLMKDGRELDSYYAKITRSSWHAARAILKSRQVVFDPDAVSVPNSPFPA